MQLNTSFKEKSSKIHNNHYDYSLVVYKDSKTKVKIICSIHGVFEQTPNNHLKGSGCPKCGIVRANSKNRATLNNFIEKAKEKHPNKYDYSIAMYKNSSTKIKIICPLHGIFEQRPNGHLNGNGCPKCAHDNYVPIHKLDTNSFIKKAKEKHGDIYDYSISEYVRSTDPLKIICPTHGVYEQIANSHLCGCGCPSCAEEYRHDSCRATKEEFVIKAINRHGNIYDYSKIVYVNALSKVAIICKKHGIFYQTPGSHLYGQGCPHCLESHGEKIIAAILDANAVRYEREKHFYGCSCKRKLLFDFYIPSENMCIEYDGIQHFEPITHFGGKVAFEKIRTYDKIKNDFCKDKGILLIRFSYMDKKEYIQNVLCSIIKPSMRV